MKKLLNKLKTLKYNIIDSIQFKKLIKNNTEQIYYMIYMYSETMENKNLEEFSENIDREDQIDDYEDYLNDYHESFKPEIKNCEFSCIEIENHEECVVFTVKFLCKATKEEFDKLDISSNLLVETSDYLTEFGIIPAICHDYEEICLYITPMFLKNNQPIFNNMFYQQKIKEMYEND